MARSHESESGRSGDSSFCDQGAFRLRDTGPLKADAAQTGYIIC